MTNKRLFFEAGNDDQGVQIIAFEDKNTASISLNDDWCGDTETGFGATITVDITREDAVRLIEMLNTWLLNKE